MRRRWSSKYGKPGYITHKGYFHLFNGCNSCSWCIIPSYFVKLIDRLRATIIKIKVLKGKVFYISLITIPKTESKLNRVAYINQLINNLL